MIFLSSFSFAKTLLNPSDNFIKFPSSVTLDSRRRGFTSTYFRTMAEATLGISFGDEKSLLKKTLALGVLATVRNERFL